jgi:RHS repeat-associated protein
VTENTGPAVTYSSANYDRQMNRYTQVGALSQVYDLAGNLKDDGKNLYTYDGFNRLIKVVRKSDAKTVAEYKYDAFNRRIRKTVTDSGALNGVTHFIYNGAMVIEEYEVASPGAGETLTLRARNFNGRYIDELCVFERKDVGDVDGDGNKTELQRFYYHTDSLGSVRAVTWYNGTDEKIIERVAYDIFGKATIWNWGPNRIFGDGDDVTAASTSLVGNPYLFTGRDFDAETGLYYYRNRYYSPETGRFVSQDPLGYINGPNLYQYCFSDPVNFFDPWGLSSKSERGPALSYEDLAEILGRPPRMEDIREITNSGIFSKAYMEWTGWANENIAGGTIIGAAASAADKNYGDAVASLGLAVASGAAHAWSVLARFGRGLAGVKEGTGGLKGGYKAATAMAGSSAALSTPLQAELAAALARLAAQNPALLQKLLKSGLLNAGIAAANGLGTGYLSMEMAEAKGGSQCAGKYKDVGGHHPHAKASFKDHPTYSKEEGFSISKDFMEKNKWDHQEMTNMQRKLFDELAASGSPNTLKEQSRIAVEALKAGGASEAEARSIVAQSLRNLREQGVRAPTRIPWQKR